MQQRPDVFINGRFLAKPAVGVSRFAVEVLLALDTLLAEECGEGDLPGFSLLVPNGCNVPVLRAISVVRVGRFSGHLWEQLELYSRSKTGYLLNFCNTAPLLQRNQLVVIHDAMVYKFPQNFTLAFRTAYQVLFQWIKSSADLFTVSRFSRTELAHSLNLPSSKIGICSNSFEHVRRWDTCSEVLARLGLENERYLLFVGSPAANKNLERAIKAFLELRAPTLKMVIVGSAKSSVFADIHISASPNVLLAGKLSDAELASLYKGALCLVFPSLYEGFGIPPLEGMALGCPVMASCIPAVQEVCGEAALYFDPLDVADITCKMKMIWDSPLIRAELKEAGAARLSHFSWRNSAKVIYEQTRGRWQAHW